MPEHPQPTQAEQLKALEDARVESKATYERAAHRARDGWLARIARLEQEIAEARVLQAEAEAKRLELAPLVAHPQALEYHLRMVLLVEINTQLIKMNERQIACYRECIARGEAYTPEPIDPAPPLPVYPMPKHDLAYLEARARFDFVTLAYHWRHQMEALDALLRMASQPVKVSDDPAVEQARKERAEPLRALLRTDRDLAVLMGKLGQDLTDARALLEWASQSLQTVGQLPEDLRRKALADTDWARLNGAVQAVLGLPQRVAKWPQLVALFGEQPFVLQLPPEPEPEAVEGAEALADEAAEAVEG